MKIFKIKVKESSVAEYLVKIESDEGLSKDDIFSKGEIIDTLDDGNGESVSEEVISCVEVQDGEE